MKKSFLKSYVAKTISLFAIVLMSTSLFAQTRTVTGLVTNSTGEPIVGASVIVKENPAAGINTGSDGRYSLPNVPASATLVYSYIGMETQEIASGSRTSIDVTLSDSSVAIEEMVVIGYGSIKKADLTGAVSVVSTDEFKNKANNSIADALQGMAAGVNVRSSGDLGSLPTVLIRGTSSLTDNTPLYIIDGMPTSNNIGFNVSDIETIQVLKDASAAAIYGSRAANGVIIITTKTGEAGKVSINFSNQTSVQWNKRLDFADHDEWVDIMTGVYEDGIARGTTSEKAVPSFWNNNTDWQDEYFKTGVQQNYNLSFSGGSKDARFRASFSRLENSGSAIGRNMSRTTASINSQFNKGIFTFGESAQFGMTNQYSTSNTGLSNVVAMTPIVPVRDDSEFGKDGWGLGNRNYAYTTAYNVVAAADPSTGNTKSENNYLRANAWAQVKLADYLTFKTNLGANINDNHSRSWSTGRQYALNFTDLASSASGSASRSTTYLIENTLNFDKSFGNHTINAVLGQSYQDNFNSDVNGTRQDLIATAGGIYLKNVSSGTSVTGASGTTGQSRLISYFGRVNYSYDSRYLLQVTVRRDGSSRFAPGNQWGTFPSVSAGWRVAQEEFWNVDWMNDLKIRYSYGELGSQNVGNYDYMSLINSYASYLFGGDLTVTNGQAITQLANSDISWERLIQHNFGVDMAFLNNRLLVTAEYYISKSKDCLYAQDILRTTGATNSPTVNSASLTNKGVEVSINWRDKIGKDFSYSIMANFSHNSNTLDKLGYGVTEYYTTTTASRIGQPIGQYYLIKSDGLFQSDEEVQNYKSASGTVIQPTAKAGDIKFIDYNGDGKINSSDKQIIDDKSPWPGLEASLSIMMNYKNWDLQIAGFGELFKWTYNGTRATTDGLSGQSQIRSGMNWWSESNKHNNVWYPREAWGYTTNDLSYTDRWLERGDFFKFNSLAVGYNWTPTGVISKVIKNLRVSVTAQNMLTMTRFTGYDPDFRSGSLFTPGNAGTGFSNPYTVIFGLNMTF